MENNSISNKFNYVKILIFYKYLITISLSMQNLKEYVSFNFKN